MELHGIAIDEALRSQNNSSKAVYYPLLFWGMTEDQCLKFCYDRGFDWRGLYRDFKRVSCFCCPHSSIPELRTMFLKYPDLWKRMVDMDGGRNWMFKNGKSIQWWSSRFEKESQIKNSGFGLLSTP